MIDPPGSYRRPPRIIHAHLTRTLKEHLIAHLRARPGKNDPETRRIAKEFHSTQAVDLEKSLLRDHLEGHLRSRAGGFY